MAVGLTTAALIGQAMPYAFGAGQAALSFFGGQSKAREQQRQAAAQHGQAVFKNQFQNLMIDRQNDLTRERFGKQVDLANTQFQFNREAAQRAQSAEQVRMNEQMQGFAFQQSNMRASLLQAQGANAAAGRAGNRSLARASAVATLGNYGRQQAVLAENLASARGQSRRNMERISRQRLSADNRVFSQVAIPPQLQTRNAALAAPTVPRMNMGLMIGQAAMSGLSTAYNMTAPGGKFLGFEKPGGTE